MNLFSLFDGVSKLRRELATPTVQGGIDLLVESVKLKKTVVTEIEGHCVSIICGDNVNSDMLGSRFYLMIDGHLSNSGSSQRMRLLLKEWKEGKRSIHTEGFDYPLLCKNYC